MAAKHHITVAEIHENNAADLEKVILIKKMTFEISVNTICIKSHFFYTAGSLTVYAGKSMKQSQP